MTKFFVRVELKGENRKDSDIYQRLHTEMEKEGFVRYFTNTKGEKMALPHATYKLKRNVNVTDAKNEALSAARKVWPRPKVVLVVAVEYSDNLAFELD
jgi:hypothetical protein